MAISFELQQVFYPNGTFYVAHDVGLLAIDVSFYLAIGADHDLGSTLDISLDDTIDADIAATGDIPLENGSIGDNAGTCLAGSFVL
jgi:hypothetical protein